MGDASKRSALGAPDGAARDSCGEPGRSEALRGEAQPEHRQAGVEVVLLTGLPGAGKTTFFRRHFAATHRHLSKDLWPNARGRESRQRRLLDEALAAGVPVVVDNTNPTIAERAAIIAGAHARGARVVAYFFDITTRQAVARNAGRTGRDKVPNVAIFTCAKRFEPPTLREGFDQLFRVVINDDRTLSVSEMTT